MSKLSIVLHGNESAVEWQSNWDAWEDRLPANVDFYYLVPPIIHQSFAATSGGTPMLSVLPVDVESLGASFSRALSESKSEWLLFLDARRPLSAVGLRQLMSAIEDDPSNIAFWVTQYSRNPGQTKRRVAKWSYFPHADRTEDFAIIFSRRAILALQGFRETCRFRPLYDLVIRASKAKLSWKQLDIELAGSIDSSFPLSRSPLPLGRHLESLEEGLKISQTHYGQSSKRWALRIGRAAADLAGLDRSYSRDYDQHVLSIARAYRDASGWWDEASLRLLHTAAEAKAILKRPKVALRFFPNRPAGRWKADLGRRVFKLGYHEAMPCRIPANYAQAKLLTWAPRISITTPSLNQAGTLERTILSVLSQGYPHLEYTIQDGGSKDGSANVMSRYEDRLTRWVSEPDRGQADAIVRGFEETSGEIMAYLNSDDVLLPGALDFVGRFFAEHPDVDVVYGDRVLIDHADREINRWYLPSHDDETIAWADFIPQETLFWRRRSWDAVGGIDPTFHFAMDWDLILRFRRAGMRFVHVPRLLGAFRVSHAQKTQTLLATTGYREMCRLRHRELGYVPSEKEVAARVRNYVRKHRIVSGWRLLLQHWTKTEVWTAMAGDAAYPEWIAAPIFDSKAV